jgi:Subtilase family
MRMNAKRVKQGADYQSVAVCSKDPRWYLRRWTELTDDILESTHLAQADELLVEQGAGYALGPEWRPVDAYDDVTVYRRSAPQGYGDQPPSGVPIMAEVGRPGVSPNAILCSQGLRMRGPERTDVPFRVAPRYQGLWMQEARPLSADETKKHVQSFPKAPPPSERGKIDIGIVDTGVAQGQFLNPFLEKFVASQWLVGAEGADPPDPDGNGAIEPPAGHGTFVAGVIAQIEPRVRLHVIRAVGRQGAVSDAQLAGAIDTLVRELAGAGIELDILNLSLGGWTHDDRQPLMVADRISRLSSHTLVVSAAGNLESRRKFWPAAMERVVSVGAVVQDGAGWERAEYSNYGDWVSAVAHDGGVHVQGKPSEGEQKSTYYTAFPPEGPVTAGGWAAWRGTSFTTPTVAAHVAKVMLDDNLRTGQEAWERLRERSKATTPPAEFPNAVVVS